MGIPLDKAIGYFLLKDFWGGMRLGWKVFLPTSLLWVVVTAGWVLVFHHHP